MKRLLGVSFLLILASFAANAATITTGLFSIEVPDQWNVEDNKTNIVLAFGTRVVDGMPSPFLSVQYCVNGSPSNKSGQNRCGLPCAEEATNLASDSRMEGAQFSPIAKTEKENGVIEYISELTSPAPVAALAALSCYSTGQIHVGLVSDSPREVAKKQFAEILKSLKWK